MIGYIGIFLACKKNGGIESVKNNQDKQILKTFHDEVLLWENLSQDLYNIGAEELDIPTDYLFPLTKEEYQWDRVKLLQLTSTNTIYRVYIWEKPEAPGFILAQTMAMGGECCCHKWYQDGSCKDDGSDCDVTYDAATKEITIICCDEPLTADVTDE